MGTTKRGKGTKIMGVADRYGLPLALRRKGFASESHARDRHPGLPFRSAMPHRFIGDRAYDGDRLDDSFAA